MRQLGGDSSELEVELIVLAEPDTKGPAELGKESSPRESHVGYPLQVPATSVAVVEATGNIAAAPRELVQHGRFTGTERAYGAYLRWRRTEKRLDIVDKALDTLLKSLARGILVYLALRLVQHLGSSNIVDVIDALK